MEYTRFGNTGMEISRLSLGTMTFGGKLDRAECARVVDEALDKGVNLIDTADSYGDSEEILGAILTPEKRERIFLATKVYLRFCREGRIARNSRTNIFSSLERSLRLLKTDYVDLYQLHHPDPSSPIEETLETLDTIVKQGKARYVGVSNHYAWQMAHMLGEAKARGYVPIVSYQANYSILDRQIEFEALEFVRKFNIALMCYSPLSSGVLTGKYHTGKGVPEGSRATSLRYVERYLEDETVSAIVAELKAVAAEQELEMNQLAILWLLGKSDVTTVILGGSRPDHFSQIYEIADRTLPEEVVDKIDALSEPRIYSPYINQSQRTAPAINPGA